MTDAIPLADDGSKRKRIDVSDKSFDGSLIFDFVGSVSEERVRLRLDGINTDYFFNGKEFTDVVISKYELGTRFNMHGNGQYLVGGPAFRDLCSDVFESKGFVPRHSRRDKNYKTS
jgi:hypothetical protein